MTRPRCNNPRGKIKACGRGGPQHYLCWLQMSFNALLPIRILAGTQLGYAIGRESEIRGSPAGDRTYGLVALGAAAFRTAGVEHFPATSENVMAGIVSGVGSLAPA